MGHETPFLFSLRPETKMKKKNPKEIDLRPKLAKKETEII
jgi:hypothetical protein